MHPTYAKARRYNRMPPDEVDTGHTVQFPAPKKACLHFIGFRGEEYWSAVRIWGKPDYTWERATFRILGECAPDDTVIFGPSAFNKPKKWRSAA